MTSVPWGLLVRRAVHQRVLLAAVLAVVVAGTVFLGTCVLLVTDGQQDALRASLARSPASGLSVETTARLTEDGAPSEVVGVVQDSTATALADLDPEVSTWSTSQVRYLRPAPPGAPADVPLATYVSSVDDLPDRASLDEGRWPTAPTGGPTEVALPSSTAALLGVHPGSELVLHASQRDDAAETTTTLDDGPPIAVVIVGTFTPVLDEGAWDRDLLRGAGHDPQWQRPETLATVPVAAYGPFVVDQGAFLDGSVPLDSVNVQAQPRLSGEVPQSAGDVRAVLDALETAVQTEVGDGATDVRVRSELVSTLRTALTRQQVSGAVVLVVAVVGSVLAAAALALAALLLTGRRTVEAALVAARGAGRAQLAAQAFVEGLVLVVLAAVIALPLTLALYGWLARSPVLAAAGLRAPTTPGPTLVLTVAAGCILLVAVLVLPALRRPDHHRRTRSGGRGAVARSSADLVLLALAVVGFFQLRSHTVAPGAGPDAVLVAAPVLCLLAGAALALRLVPLVARVGERGAARSRRLVGPLAAWEVARRSQASGTAFLIVLATAAGTFGVALASTWTYSQQDQADAFVGADLSVVADGPSVLAHAAALGAAAGGDPTPVTDRDVILGASSSVGARTELSMQGAGPRLVAVDTRTAAGALRGRLPEGASWSALTADLAPTEPTAPIHVSGTASELVLVVTGSVTGGAQMTDVVPTVVVEGPSGHREALAGTSVPLDGQPHSVSIALPSATAGAPDLRVVAVSLRIAVGADDALPPHILTTAQTTVAVSLPGDGTTPGPDGLPDDASWSTATSQSLVGTVESTSTRLTHDAAGTTITSETALVLPNIASPVDLQLQSFAAPEAVPLLLTQELADAIAAAPGTEISLGLGQHTVAGRVVGTVPYVPSAPRSPAVLVDYDALSRALLTQGMQESLTDRWMISSTDPADVAARITDAGLGTTVTATGVGADLREGLSQVIVPAALRILVAAAFLLALAGTALHTAATVQARGIEVARLQGVGVPRRSVAAALVLERAVVSLVSITAGAVVGAVVGRAVGPSLVVADDALPPVPSVLARWPWPEQGLLLGALVLGIAAVVVPVARHLVRRATTAHLRMDSAS
ncbi:FtsX-like permease family protein [Sanguibacter sp. 25GB23B1]|uniref:FtsX-like permease family protein n=1 Tax=unclassified Sanguibacter TaxID=2645534 RepID=UPI0032AF263A